VIQFNEKGPDGLVNAPSLGAPAKFDDTDEAFLAAAEWLSNRIFKSFNDIVEAPGS
jgi:hypothetical protein